MTGSRQNLCSCCLQLGQVQWRLHAAGDVLHLPSFACSLCTCELWELPGAAWLKPTCNTFSASQRSWSVLPGASLTQPFPHALQLWQYGPLPWLWHERHGWWLRHGRWLWHGRGSWHQDLQHGRHTKHGLWHGRRWQPWVSRSACAYTPPHWLAMSRPDEAHCLSITQILASSPLHALLQG